MLIGTTPKQRLTYLVKELRGEKSLRHFGKQLGVSYQTVALWEQERTWPDDEHLRRLAELKGWTPEQLQVYLEGNPESDKSTKSYTETSEGVPSVQQLLTGIRKKAPGHNTWQELVDINQPNASNPLTHIVGGQPPDTTCFYGRTPELALLRAAIAEEHCVVLLGAPGIGKSALMAKLIHEVGEDSRPKFDCFFWKSLHYAPSLEDLVTELLYLLAEEFFLIPVSKLELLSNTQDKISVLIEFLKTCRCLLVLDAAEAVLRGERKNGCNPYGDYAEYGVFLRRLVEEQHQSCLVLTSREPFVDIEDLQRRGQPARTEKIEGLGKEALQILQSKGLVNENKWGDLIHKYRGNPLLLQMVSSRIQELFDGSVQGFLDCKTTWIGDSFQRELDEQFGTHGRLTTLEKQIIVYLAGELNQGCSSVAFTQLINNIKSKDKITKSTSELIEATGALIKRSLVEKNKSVDGAIHLTLQPVVKKYVITDPLGLLQVSFQNLKFA